MRSPLTDKELEYAEREWKSVPLPALASKFDMPVLELIASLRARGIITEIQPIELQFIADNLDTMPASEIRKKMSLSSSQFSQICQKVLRRTQRKGRENMTLDEAIKKTRWLVEEKLHHAVDDFLPRQISNESFSENDLYDCVRFAESAKKDDGYYQHFPVVAFLICHAYPGRFRPFQFRHAKTNAFFSGREGRGNFLNAIRWVLEKKLGVDLGKLSIVSRNKYFLRSRDLQFYGLGYHWYKQHFSSNKEIIAELMKIHSKEAAQDVDHTRRLRENLSAAGVDIKRCAISSCYYDDEYGIDVHHIIPRADKHEVRIDINMAHNLIPLCPNHHRMARSFDWKNLSLKNSVEWRQRLIRHILSKGSQRSE